MPEHGRQIKGARRVLVRHGRCGGLRHGAPRYGAAEQARLEYFSDRIPPEIKAIAA